MSASAWWLTWTSSHLPSWRCSAMEPCRSASLTLLYISGTMTTVSWRTTSFSTQQCPSATTVHGRYMSWLADISASDTTRARKIPCLKISKLKNAHTAASPPFPVGRERCRQRRRRCKGKKNYALNQIMARDYYCMHLVLCISLVLISCILRKTRSPSASEIVWDIQICFEPHLALPIRWEILRRKEDIRDARKNL